jgi:hypothetical protein
MLQRIETFLAPAVELDCDNKDFDWGADVRFGGVSELRRELETDSKRMRSKAACMSAVQGFAGSLVALSAGSAAMADEYLPPPSSQTSTPLRLAGTAADTEEYLSAARMEK